MPDQPTPEASAFSPCPTCGQYSHSIGDDQLAAAFLHLTAMVDHRGDGVPTQYRFDEATRDAVMVLMAQPLRIATYLDSQADAIRAKADEGCPGWAIKRHDARLFRLIADSVRAGFWKDEANG